MFKINWKLVFEFYLTIFIPLLYLLNIYIALILPNTFNISFQLKILGILVSIFGLFFWITSYIHLGKSFGILPQKQRRVKTGLYKYFNHPMYIGISAVLIGISLANASSGGLIFYNLIILPLLIARSSLESRNLKS